MATATKKSRANGQVPRRAGGRSESAAITFRAFEDNGGGYCWTILGSDDESVAYSRPYATRDEAAHAAAVGRAAAGSGRCELRAAPDRPVDFVDRRGAAVAHDDFDAERWLDECGSFSSEAVTQWPAER